jgi:hypothetical protein
LEWQIIINQLHFYPHTNSEASRAIALLGRGQQDLSVLGHLNEIYVHQRKLQADAPSSVRAVVHSFEDYAGNAANELHYMESFLERLKRLEANNRTGFATLFPLNDWHLDTNLIASFTAMSRYVETVQEPTNIRTDDTTKQVGIGETKAEERQERIICNLGALRVSELTNVALAVQTHESHRFDYWVEQLRGSRMHLFARDVANTALSELAHVR